MDPPSILEKADETPSLTGSWSFNPHLLLPHVTGLTLTNSSIPLGLCLGSFKRITYTKGASQSAAGVVG